MSIDPLYQDICDNIEKNTYLNPKNCSIVAGLVTTPLALLFAPVIATSTGALLLIKGISVATGSGVGWKFGSEYYSGTSIAISLVHQPDAWRQLHNFYQTDDSKIEFCEEAIEEQMLNSSTGYGKLYRFANFLFAERYEHLFTRNKQDNYQGVKTPSHDAHILRELNYLVTMMTLKHPMYTADNHNKIKTIVEQRAMEDLYSYIYGHYVMESRRNGNTLPPMIIIGSSCVKSTLSLVCPQLTDHERIVHTASLKFRHLPHLYHPKEKVAILVEMVKDIDNDLKSQGITLCCDDLIPIVSEIIMCNLDILPYAEIQLVFDYLENSCDEDAYVATVVLSSLQECYRNLKTQYKMSQTPTEKSSPLAINSLPHSRSCPLLVD